MADVWFSLLDSICSHIALCVKQFMAKSRTAIYPCTAHHIIQQTVPLYLQSLPLCTSSNRPLQYSLYNQYNNTQLLNLPLDCNCTAVCSVLSCCELYIHTSWVLSKFYHSSSIGKSMWLIRQSYNPH